MKGNANPADRPDVDIKEVCGNHWRGSIEMIDRELVRDYLWIDPVLCVQEVLIDGGEVVAWASYEEDVVGLDEKVQIEDYVLTNHTTSAEFQIGPEFEATVKQFREVVLGKP